MIRYSWDISGLRTYVKDWGRLLTNSDFFDMSRKIKEFRSAILQRKWFAILEGGYHTDLKYRIMNFIEGFA